MLLPTLEELKAKIEECKKEKPYKPSKIWTRTDALARSDRAMHAAEIEDRKKTLKINSKHLHELQKFYNYYACNTLYIQSKYTPRRILKTSMDVYKAASSIFCCDEILGFIEKTKYILDVSNNNFGRVMSSCGPIDTFVRRIGNLQCFWELSSSCCNGPVNLRERQVNGFKKDVVRVYAFMDRRRAV